MIRSYYFFNVETFAVQKRTKQQLALGSTGNSDPITELRKEKDNFYNGLTLLHLVHEDKDKTPRRLPGHPDFVDESIVGGKTLYNLYLDKGNDILIARAPKNILNNAIRRLKSQFPSDYKLKKHEVDFAGIIERTHSTVLGAWFGLEGRVKKIGLFGDRVNLDESFDRYQSVGSMTSLYIEIEFENAKTSTVLLTKEGGVILYNDWTLEQDLDFIIDVIRPLFYPEKELAAVSCMSGIK